MANFQNIKDLIRTLSQGQKLLFDMFRKRRTVPVKYDDAVETLDGNENILLRMIKFGVIVQSGNNLELEDSYQEFFEKVLAVNEEINIASVKEYIESLKRNIQYYCIADSILQPKYLREIRHIFRSIKLTTHRNVLDLKRNVEYTYKQEPNFKIKELRLKAFDEKASSIDELIKQTEKLIDDEAIFIANIQDISIKETINEVRRGLKASAHGLISIKAQIIDYLNRIQYQNSIVKRVRKLKYLKDQMLIGEGTDIYKVLAEDNAIWFEPRITFSTKVSLDFLHNDDAALGMLSNIRRKLNKSTTIKSRIATAIDNLYFESQEESSRSFDHQALAEAFFNQSGDLFSFIWCYAFTADVSEEERLVLFLQLSSQFAESLRFSDKEAVRGRYEYPLIYPL